MTEQVKTQTSTPTTATPPSLSATSDSVWVAAFKEAAVYFVIAALLLIATYTVSFKQFHPEFVPFMGAQTEAVTLKGHSFQPINIGGGHISDESLVITDFAGDEAVIAVVHPFQAEDYPFIKVDLKGFTRYSKAKILWRRADDPSQIHSLEFNRSGDEVTQIAMVYGGDNYRGTINDIALLFYDGPALGFENNNDVNITVQQIALRPFSVKAVATQIFEDWTNPPLWQGYSNNIVRGIHKHGMVFPNAVANLLVVTGMVVGFAIRHIRKYQKRGAGQRQQPRLLAIALCLCLFGWVFNDVLRWHWRIEQLIDTHQRYAGLPLEERIRNNSIRCARFPDDCAADLLPYF